MKRYVVAFSILAGMVQLSNPAFAAGGRSMRLYTPHRVAEVMTYNCYLGTDLTAIIQALQGTDPTALLTAVATAWAQVQASNIPERTASIAQEIAASKPDLVGL